VIERTFGVLKKKFKILDVMPAYLFEVQIKIITATSVVHNFTRRYTTPEGEEIFLEQVEADLADADTHEPRSTYHDPAHFSNADRREAAEFRDSIAKSMWESYQRYSASS
jgi:hypothetical protein